MPTVLSFSRLGDVSPPIAVEDVHVAKIGAKGQIWVVCVGGVLGQIFLVSFSIVPSPLKVACSLHRSNIW